MKFELRENETAVKTSQDMWHVVQHGEKIGAREMFKAAYKQSLFRTPLLTNQRLVLLKDREIDYEIPLDNVAEVTSHRQLKIGTPYFRVESTDGEVVNIVFECITERVVFGAAVESEIAWRMTKEWVTEINRQANMIAKGTKTIGYRSARTRTPALESTAGARHCTKCGANLPLDAGYCPDCGAEVGPRPPRQSP